MIGESIVEKAVFLAVKRLWERKMSDLHVYPTERCGSWYFEGSSQLVFDLDVSVELLRDGVAFLTSCTCDGADPLEEPPNVVARYRRTGSGRPMSSMNLQDYLYRHGSSPELLMRHGHWISFRAVYALPKARVKMKRKYLARVEIRVRSTRALAGKTKLTVIPVLMGQLPRAAAEGFRDRW